LCSGRGIAFGFVLDVLWGWVGFGFGLAWASLGWLGWVIETYKDVFESYKDVFKSYKS